MRFSSNWRLTYIFRSVGVFLVCTFSCRLQKWCILISIISFWMIWHRTTGCFLGPYRSYYESSESLIKKYYFSFLRIAKKANIYTIWLINCLKRVRHSWNFYPNWLTTSSENFVISQLMHLLQAFVIRKISTLFTISVRQTAEVLFLNFYITEYCCTGINPNRTYFEINITKIWLDYKK